MRSISFAIILFTGMIVSVTANSQSATIPVETSNNALVLQVKKNKQVDIIYFGKKLSNTDEYALVPGQFKRSSDDSGVLQSAYTPSGSTNLTEPAIAVTHADGNTSLVLRYVTHQLEKTDENVSLLKITLADPVYPFQVDLFYKSYYKEDLIEQWSVIRHKESGNVTLHKFASANLCLKAEAFWLTQYHGQWGKEMQPEVSKLTHGIRTLDSKLGTRANLYQPSVFMISMDKPATEDEGTVLYGAMEWSGNFRIDLEMDPMNNLRIIGGMNNFASEYSLAPGEEFQTPEFLYLLAHHGKGEASRKMHAWAKDYKICNGNGDRSTLLNNWEATYFNFDEKKLFELIQDTKKLGVDLFLLDDGWFGNEYPRNNDRAGLGDWQPNREKLPNGISSLVKEATKNGVGFGIWVEPEMVNPKSELYLQHPDWVIKQPDREEYYFRNQLVLDLSNPEVQDFVFSVVDGLFEENPDLAYVKWDCNAVIYNAYSAHLGKQSHLYIDYVRGLYSVLKKIREKHPSVPMMLCSGGGGRVDYAALQYFTEFWPSDNTNPLDRIFIQWEYSYFYPALSMSCHVTNWGNQSMKYKVDVAMMGKLGFDIVVGELGKNDLEFCQQAIKNYNELKDIIWHGDQYRLANPWENDFASLMYVNEDKSGGVIFSYLVNNRYDKGSKLPVKLKGLDPAKKYKLKEMNLYPGTKPAIDEGQVYSGDFLMTVGFNPMVYARSESVVIKIVEN